MISRWITFLTLLLIGSAAGCQSPRRPGEYNAVPPKTVSAAKADFGVRDNAFALLYDLLEQEKDVRKVLFIKFESDELNHLVKDISAVAKKYLADFEPLTKALPGYDPKNLGLPPGEVAARNAVSKTKTKAILLSHGPDFEFEMLLSQAQALDYGAHLAQVAAQNETNPNRAGEFSALAGQLNALYERTIFLMRHQY